MKVSAEEFLNLQTCILISHKKFYISFYKDLYHRFEQKDTKEENIILVKELKIREQKGIPNVQIHFKISLSNSYSCYSIAKVFSCITSHGSPVVNIMKDREPQSVKDLKKE